MWYNVTMTSYETLTKNLTSVAVDELRALVVSQQKQLESLELYKSQLDNYKLENEILREKINKLTHKLFGRKSEKYIFDEGFEQTSLFDTEEHSPCSQDDAEEDASKEIIFVPGHERKKKGRKALPPELPRHEIVHDLSAEEKQCQCGCQMVLIGEESSEKLEIRPPRVLVIRHTRLKYACKSCEGVESTESPVKLAPPPVQILPKSMATPSLLAHLFVSKFADSLPFYRQEKQLLRHGISLPRSTMTRWAFEVAKRLKPLLEQLHREQLCSPYLSIDETGLQVLKEPGRSVGSKSFMWVFRSGSSPPSSESASSKKIVIFRYSPQRSGSVASQYIGDYQGYVQTDGYAGYNFLDRAKGITHVGCWEHARRKFVEANRLYNGKKKKSGSGPGLSGKAITWIRKLYMIERKAQKNKLSAEEIHNLRHDEAKPILKEFEEWLKINSAKVPSKGALGDAFKYTLNQWPRLLNYLESGNVPIGNNLTENAIRPFVIGRKNWLFSVLPEGADTNAIFYSLIETAKANNIEPYSYFLYLFDKLPHADSEEELEKLLPTNLTPEELTEYKTDYWEKFK
jgi:transposase